MKDIKSNLFEGMTFAITGKFLNITRHEICDFVENKGGRVISTASGKTDYLISGFKL
jgi:NAD-dependent DNA ligase